MRSSIETSALPHRARFTNAARSDLNQSGALSSLRGPPAVLRFAAFGLGAPLGFAQQAFGEVELLFGDGAEVVRRQAFPQVPDVRPMGPFDQSRQAAFDGLAGLAHHGMKEQPGPLPHLRQWRLTLEPCEKVVPQRADGPVEGVAEPISAQNDFDLADMGAGGETGGDFAGRRHWCSLRRPVN